MERARQIAVLAAAGALLAPNASAQITRDSAGIQIIENRAAVFPPARAWRLDPKPALVIGGESSPTAGDSLYEFGGVMGLTRLTNGQWAIGVQSANQIRFYDAGGAFLKAAGRAGDGPGEFRQVMGLKRYRGDSLVVTDLFETEYLTGSGAFVAKGAVSRQGRVGYIGPQALLDDGTHVGFNYNEPAVPPAGRRIRQTPLYHVSERGARVDTLMVLPVGEAVFDGRSRWGTEVEYSPKATVAAAGARLYYMFAATAEVLELTLQRSVARRIRLAVSPLPVTSTDREDHLNWVRNMPGELGGPITPRVRELNERRAARTVFADRFPTHGLMLADRSGFLWLRRFDFRQGRFKPGPVATITVPAPTTWDVIDASGRWLCTLTMPAHFTPLEIGADYVAGISRDADDVESIHVYRIVKP